MPLLRVLNLQQIEKGKDRYNADDIDTIHITLPEGSLIDEIEKIISEQTKYFSLVSLDEEDGQKIEIIFNLKLNNFEDLNLIKKEFLINIPNQVLDFIIHHLCN